MTKNLLAAVDLGGTKILTVITGTGGNILARKQLPTPQEADAADLLETLVSAITQALREINSSPAHLRGVGLCVPGFFDVEERLVLQLPNIPRVKNFALGSALTHRLDVPVLVENDANAAAVGEAWQGAAQGHRHLVYITVSTGIGAGLILNGELYRGSRGFAGEFGHMQVKPGGPLCGCGKEGCLEAVASGTAIARQARKALQKHKDSLLSRRAAENNGKITAADVFWAARAQDRTATAIVEEAINYLGIGISNVINFLNPSLVVLGGGVTNAGDIFFAPLQKVVAKHVVAHTGKNVKIIPAALGGDAGVVGMLFLLQKLLS